MPPVHRTDFLLERIAHNGQSRRLLFLAYVALDVPGALSVHRRAVALWRASERQASRLRQDLFGIRRPAPQTTRGTTTGVPDGGAAAVSRFHGPAAQSRA